MNSHLIDYINNKLDEAAAFVCGNMPSEFSTDETYETLLACSSMNTPEMIREFKAAVKYLAPSYVTKRFNFLLPAPASVLSARVVTVNVRLAPTGNWPVFLIPSGEITITPESKLARMLELPIRVATEWANLIHMWQGLRSNDLLTPAQVAYLLPWIRECLADYRVDPTRLSKSEVRALGSGNC